MTMRFGSRVWIVRRSSRRRCAYCGKRGRLILIGQRFFAHADCFSLAERLDEARDAELAAAFSRVEEGE